VIRIVRQAVDKKRGADAAKTLQGKAVEINFWKGAQKFTYLAKETQWLFLM